MAIPIPAICRTCGTVFPSPIALGIGASATFKDISVGPCPNGHMNGFIPDGTYTIREALSRIIRGEYGDKESLAAISRIAKEAKSKSRDSQKSAVDQIAELLPPESRAAVKQLGSQHPLVTIMVFLFLLSIVAKNMGDAYKSFFPPDPPASFTINNNNSTLNYNAAPADGAYKGVPKSLNRHERRRVEKLSRKDGKVTEKKKPSAKKESP